MSVVNDGILLSPTQIKLWRECNRKWGLSYLAGFKEPGTIATELGTEIDDTQLQPYLIEGRPFDLKKHAGQCANQILDWLPKPKLPKNWVQREFRIPSPSWDTHQFRYRGYKDTYLPSSSLLPWCLDDPDSVTFGTPTGDDLQTIPIVIDYKSSGNFSYMLTPPKLAKDPQGIIYGFDAMVETGARAVRLIWMYMSTKTSKPRRSHVVLHSDYVASEMETIEETGRAIVDARKGLTGDPEKYALTLKPNLDSCDLYRGCPHKFRCNISPALNTNHHAAKLRLLEYTENEKMSDTNATVDLLSNLKRKRATVVPAATGTSQTLDASGPPVGSQKIETPATPAPDYSVNGGGINPPEKELPPAPPLNVASEEPKTETPKKRGRPAGSKKDPLGADASAHTAKKTDAEAAKDLVEAIESGGLVGGSISSLFPKLEPGETTLYGKERASSVTLKPDGGIEIRSGEASEIKKALRAAAVRFIEVLDGAA